MKIISEQLHRMVNRQGFIDEFWAVMKRCPDATYREVYDSLEAAFQAEFGTRRFPSYDAFRKARDAEPDKSEQS